ncbi:MAG TPA: succinate--CoA ligase subunit beta, partial [Burkholderiales bacterium]|nr:succinate--CoA ligase subunit beta [Burkholderiales bacterium]
EINPLIVTRDGRVVALDCKFVMDDCAVVRHADLASAGTPEKLTDRENKAKAVRLKYIELDGNVGVLANGAGLTMTTMDVVRHHGGRPANFLEIGGESYTQAKPALELLLSDPNINSLVVNFCGAFARTDVMTQGVIEAIEALKPGLPIFFSVHGTGDEEAIRMLKERLGVTPLPTMDDACKAAVEAAATVAVISEKMR